VVKLIAPHLGEVLTAGGKELLVDFSLRTTSPALFDAFYAPGGPASVATLLGEGPALVFISEAYKHFKPIIAAGEGHELVEAALPDIPKLAQQPGVVLSDGVTERFAEGAVAAIAEGRHWGRTMQGRMRKTA